MPDEPDWVFLFELRAYHGREYLQRTHFWYLPEGAHGRLQAGERVARTGILIEGIGWLRPWWQTLERLRRARIAHGLAPGYR